MVVKRGAVCSFVLAVAIAGCGEAPAAAPSPRTAEVVDLSRAAWEAAARKVEWNPERRTIRCLGTDTSLEVPPALSSRVELRSEGDVSIRARSEEDGVLLVRAKAGAFDLGDFGRDLTEGMEALGAWPPEEATLTFRTTENGQVEGSITTAPPTLAATDRAFRLRFAVVSRKDRTCRIFALAPEPSESPQPRSPPMLRLVESLGGSSIGEIAALLTIRTFGQVLGLIPSS